MPKIRVMCVQPIEVDSEQYEQLISKKSRIGKLIGTFDRNHFKIEWLKQFNALHRDLSNFKCIYRSEESKVSNLLLKQDLQSTDFHVNGLHDISEYLDLENTTYELVFDQRFFNFVLVVEIHLNLPDDKTAELLSTELTADELAENQGADFYNNLRNLLVKEHDTSALSQWGNAVRLEVCKRIQAISHIPLKSSHRPLAYIGNNSGNFTFFVEASPQDKQMKQQFLACNAKAERVKGNNTTIIDNDCVHYAFFSRFHTIMTLDIGRYYRFAPIQHHIQSTWYYVSFYSRVLDKLNSHILANDSKKTLNSKRNVIDEYINKIELLRMNNENFKLAIESDNEDVYQKIESKWNVESSLEHAKTYVSFFKDYLERAYARKAEQSNRRQNQILFIISCIQILGLISIWSDYLGLSKIERFINSTGIHTGSNVDTVLQINTWLPLGLIAVLILLMMLAYMRRD
ncbi:hypothetical protein AN944_01566 [Shewanella sp. P1-14-1]|uniref:hypothetical protein n=1 Tax=Shewanella sp. P1-14-1 TaxID=1723761 RepID=UPI0006D6748F|nr:hypothetical protein [Shewanella sp. P1-14-1]KPZ71551.1 hypothetical protein AN944_01566 [Shewanella sp. P1-14-1]